MKKFNSRLGLSVCVSLIALSSLADAQTTNIPSSARPDRVDERIRSLDGTQPSVQPQVDIRETTPESAPAGAENITFTLKNVVIEGVTAYLAADLADLYESRVGTTISLADVYGIANQLTIKYRNDGYILTQVIVPPQTIDGGVVRLQVIEGYIDGFNIQSPGDNEREAALIRSYTQYVVESRPMNIRDLERALLLINDLGGVSARAVLSPSATSPGAAGLTIITTRDGFDGELGFDNYGSRYLGRYQVSTALGFNSLFGNNERLSAQAVYAPGAAMDPELAYGTLTYAQPFGSLGTVAEMTYSYTDTRPGFTLDQLNVKGTSHYGAITLRQPFIRTRNTNLTGRIQLDARNVTNQSNIDITREDRTRAVRIGGRYEFLDNWAGIGVNLFDVELSQGLPMLGATSMRATDVTRTAADKTFSKLEAEIQRLQRLTDRINVLFGVRGQLANDAMLSSEEFGVGGTSYGRGYDPSEIVGDDGFAGKVELQVSNPFEIPNYAYNGFVFFDGGRVFNNDATTSSLKTDTLTSVGFGFQGQLFDNFDAGMIFAVPLNRKPQTEDDKSPRIYFNVTRRF